MLEQRRVDYLKAMGIGVWVPREALPHAPEPRWLPEAAANERHETIEVVGREHARPVAAADLLRAGQPSDGATASGQPANNATSTAAAANQPLREPQRQEPKSHAQGNQAFGGSALNTESARPNQPPQVAAVGTQPADQSSAAEGDRVDLTPPRFHLCFLPVSEKGLWVVDANQSLESIQPFIYRVLVGLGESPGIMPQPVTFRWPFIESRHHDQSEAVALQALGAQWQFFKAQGCQFVITLGDSARDWMGKIQAQSHHHIEHIDVLMDSADHKRALWLALQQLTER